MNEISELVLKGKFKNLNAFGLSVLLTTLAWLDYYDEELVIHILNDLKTNHPFKSSVMVRNLWAMTKLWVWNE